MGKINYLISRFVLSSLLCVLFMGVACCQPINNRDFYPGEYSNSSVIGISLPGTWRPFSDDSPWNIPIKINPIVHAGSEIIMQRITRTAANIRLGNTFLPALWVVNQDNMEKHITAGTASPFDIWDPDNDRFSNVPAPIDDTMWGEQTADGHISIIDPFHNMLWEMSHYKGISNDLINCSTFNIWDLTGTGVGDPNEGLRSKTRGGRGSGFPVIAGLIRPEEILSGEIRHALAFTFDSVKREDVYYPACRSDGKSNLFDAPAEGMLFQLNPELSDADFDNWGLSASAKIVALTLQKYGMYLCDCGGSMALQLQLLDKHVTISRQKWDEKAPGLYTTIKNIPTNQFRLIYTVDPVHSGAANIVTTPLISPVCGNYYNPVSVTITVNKAWPDAQVYYTLDVSDPTASSTLYTGPFLLSSSAVVKAKAYDVNGVPSHIMKARINISATNATAKAQIGLWSSEAELRKNPVTGAAWEAVKTAADIDFSKPVISNNNSNDDVNCLAASIVYARTGNQLYKDKVIAALEYNVSRGNPGFDSNGILTWCRNTGAYALAADLVGYRTPELEKWFRNMVETYRDPENHNNTIEEIFYRRANNWGTQAFGTLCAVYGYLKDSSKLLKIRNYWIQMVTGPNPGATYGSDISWHADQNNLRLINPNGSVKNGLNIDGIIPDDMRRNGAFSNPPPKSVTSYHWEVLQGIISGARILERFDPKLSIWETGDKAILRAVKILETDWRRDYNNGGSNWAATGDDTWILPFVDAAYGTDFARKAFDSPRLWEHGKNAGWAYVLK